MRAEDPDIDIAVNDPATAETLNRLKNGYMRGEQMRDERAAMDKDREEREQFVDLVRTDPVGFVAANLPAESRAETALYLLTQPDIWPHVVDDIRALVENPNVLRIARAELETARFKIRDQMRAASDERATVRTEVRAIEGHLSALVPDTMEEVQSQVFVNDCRRDLATYARQTGAKSIDARLIPQILAPRLQAYGITMMDAAQRIARGAGAGARPRPTGIPSTTGVKAPARSTVSAKKTPQELRAVHARKVNAATPAPGNVVPTSGGGDTELKGKNLAELFGPAPSPRGGEGPHPVVRRGEHGSHLSPHRSRCGHEGDLRGSGRRQRGRGLGTDEVHPAGCEREVQRHHRRPVRRVVA